MYSTILQYNLVKMSYWKICNIYQSNYFFSNEVFKILKDFRWRDGEVCHFCITIMIRIANIVVVSEQVSWTHLPLVGQKDSPAPNLTPLAEPVLRCWGIEKFNQTERCFENTFFGKMDLQMTYNWLWILNCDTIQQNQLWYLQEKWHTSSLNYFLMYIRAFNN